MWMNKLIVFFTLLIRLVFCIVNDLLSFLRPVLKLLKKRLKLMSQIHMLKVDSRLGHMTLIVMSRFMIPSAVDG